MTPVKKPRPSKGHEPDKETTPAKRQVETPQKNSPVVKMREKKPPSTPTPLDNIPGVTFQGYLHRKATLMSPVKKASNRLGVPHLQSAMLCLPCNFLNLHLIESLLCNYKML